MIVELNPTCCSQTSSGKITDVIKYVAPIYPPAAKAVHATGEVVVEVKIDKDGKVISAEAVSGHPLLKQAGIQAAKLWLFSADENSTEREGQIVFAFVPLGNLNDAANFKKPSRLEIIKREPDINY
ncbi:MAG: energy transducer TonB [Pyrinomonadaceae bacterium]